MQAFLTHLQTEHAHFLAYFTTNYCSRLPQWAACYRTQTTINTIMYLESFHRVLKILYLNHKQNRRIDSLLITLMRVARDKAFEHFRKLEMGKNSHRICEHKRALLLKLFSATQIENTNGKYNHNHLPIQIVWSRKLKKTVDVVDFDVQTVKFVPITTLAFA